MAQLRRNTKKNAEKLFSPDFIARYFVFILLKKKKNNDIHTSSSSPRLNVQIPQADMTKNIKMSDIVGYTRDIFIAINVLIDTI